MADGIVERHGKKGTSYQAFVYVGAGKRKTKTFATEKQAIRWRAGIITDLAKGVRNAGKTGVTVGVAGEKLIDDMTEGVALTRSGDRYKPSVIRSYANSLKVHVYPQLEGAMIEDVTRADVQHLVDSMLRTGANASTVRNALMPLRVIYRRAIQRSVVHSSPCENLEVPAVRGKRDRIASPDEASRLIAAAPAVDRPIWAAAFYAGLRRGELRGLRVKDVDLDAGVIRVEQAMDEFAGVIEVKTRAGRRTVPLLEVLRPFLANLPDDGLAFPSGRGNPFNIGRVRLRADEAWRRTYECGCTWKPSDDEKEPPLVCAEHGKPHLKAIGLHECRHTFVSICIDAGVNAKQLSTFIGHSSIQVTYDRYGHLMPGSETEAANQIDAYLTRKSAANSTANAGGEHG